MRGAAPPPASRIVKVAPLPGPGLSARDRAAMQFDDALDDREAEAGRALAGGRLGGQPLEAAEQARHVLRREAGPVVRDTSMTISSSSGAHRELDRAADRAVLDGVADEIVDRLAQAVGIAARQQVRRRRIERESPAACVSASARLAVDDLGAASRRDRPAPARIVMSSASIMASATRSLTMPVSCAAELADVAELVADLVERRSASRRASSLSISARPRITPSGFLRSCATVPSTSFLNSLARRSRSHCDVSRSLAAVSARVRSAHPLLQAHVGLAAAARTG